VLARFGHLEQIPDDWRTWSVNATSPARLARTLAEHRDEAFLFRRLATLRTDIDVFDSVEDLRWKGPKPEFKALAARMDAARTAETSPPRSP
jgi:5'-3' exonuclease